MGIYDKKGGYAAYDKNNKERQAEDFYATPPIEVTNICKTLGIKFENTDTVLDDSCGAGHLIKGIREYSSVPKIIGTDIKNRNNGIIDSLSNENTIFYSGDEYDFLLDTYPIKEADYVIINPPYSIFIPFVQKSLEIAKKKLIVLGRLKALEGKARYDQIFENNPPSDVYVYIDRINCVKNGEFESTKGQGIESYAWFVWDKEEEYNGTQLHWMKRA